MSDATVTPGRSEADIALTLLQIIADAEKKVLHTAGTKTTNADRKWILDTYAECLRTIRNPSGRE